MTGRCLRDMTKIARLRWLRHWQSYLWASPFCLLVAFFLLLPLAGVFVQALRDSAGALTLSNVSAVFSNAFYLQSIAVSLKLGVVSSVVGLLLGFQGAYSLYAVRHSKFGLALIHINSLLSNFSGVQLAFAMMIVLGNSGFVTLVLQTLKLDLPIDIYGYSGIILCYIYFQIPLAILLLFPAIAAVQPEWQESAALLGASFANYFCKVALPVLAPALLGTFTVLLANALGAYATAYALTNGNFNILPIRIAALIAGNIALEPNMAAALAMVLVSLMLIMTALHQYLLRHYQT